MPKPTYEELFKIVQEIADFRKIGEFDDDSNRHDPDSSTIVEDHDCMIDMTRTVLGMPTWINHATGLADTAPPADF